MDGHEIELCLPARGLQIKRNFRENKQKKVQIICFVKVVLSRCEEAQNVNNQPDRHQKSDHLFYDRTRNLFRLLRAMFSVS
jgi:hypothetical protein